MKYGVALLTLHSREWFYIASMSQGEVCGRELSAGCYTQIMNDTEIWLERLSSLYRSQMRQAANAQGIQLVHFEILQYLAICNRYSNTAQSMVEYLGQTKGSISQSLKLMRNSGYIKREACCNDKRVSRVHLTESGYKCYLRLSENLNVKHENDPEVVALLKSLSMSLNKANLVSGFGQCKSCRHKEENSLGGYSCGLTGEMLSDTDMNKICREHEFSTP